MSNQDQYTVEELDRENKELKASLADIQNGWNEASEDIHCILSYFKDNAPHKVDDSRIYNLVMAIKKSQSQSLADIKANAIEELIKEKAYSTQVNGIATSIIDVDGAIQYANNLRGKS